MPFRVESFGTVASPNLPARKGILALRHAHPSQLTRVHRWIKAKTGLRPLEPVGREGLRGDDLEEKRAPVVQGSAVKHCGQIRSRSSDIELAGLLPQRSLEGL